VFSPELAVPAGPSSAARTAATSSITTSGGFSWYIFGPDNRLQYDVAGALGNGSWGYIVGTYDKDAGPNNQRLYLNGARVAQTSDTLPIDLNSAALGIGRHVSGIADPFNGHIDEFPDLPHPALRRLARDYQEQHERPRRVRRGSRRGAGKRRAATACRHRCGRLPDGVRANGTSARRVFIDEWVSIFASCHEPGSGAPLAGAL